VLLIVFWVLMLGLVARADADVMSVVVSNLGQPGLESTVPQPPVITTDRGGCANVFDADQANGVAECPAGTWPAPDAGWGPGVDVSAGDTLQLSFSSGVSAVTVAVTSQLPLGGLTDPSGVHHLNVNLLGPQPATPTSDPLVWSVAIPDPTLITRQAMGAPAPFSIVATDAQGSHDFALSVLSPRYDNEATHCGAPGHPMPQGCPIPTPPGLPLIGGPPPPTSRTRAAAQVVLEQVGRDQRSLLIGVLVSGCSIDPQAQASERSDHVQINATAIASLAGSLCAAPAHIPQLVVHFRGPLNGRHVTGVLKTIPASVAGLDAVRYKRMTTGRLFPVVPRTTGMWPVDAAAVLHNQRFRVTWRGIGPRGKLVIHQTPAPGQIAPNNRVTLTTH
jgi:hypothetical protein